MARRDLRLDLFRGVANWAIFLDHVPHEAMNWLTVRHYGFSDAADIFVFIAGYTAAIAFGRLLIEKGWAVAVSRAIHRSLELYAAHILTLMVFVVVVAAVAHTIPDLDDLHQYNVDAFTDAPLQGFVEALTLRYKPVNLDVMPLYVLLIGSLVPAIWVVVRRPNWLLAASFVLYVAARHCGWNLSAYPGGVWYFNPFTWQFLFVLGAWFAVVGRDLLGAVARSPAVMVIGVLYLLLAFAVTFEPSRAYCPDILTSVLIPNDKTNLAPYRILHLLALAAIVTNLLHADSPLLLSKWAVPAIRCGQHSLPVFCAGSIISFVAHAAIEQSANALSMQILAGFGGIAIMTLIGTFCARNAKKGRGTKQNAINPGAGGGPRAVAVHRLRNMERTA